tara:strand:+ start:297 stop:728 length:432 start_codon:yes stop_codon:yes gene_type:complete
MNRTIGSINNLPDNLKDEIYKYLNNNNSTSLNIVNKKFYKKKLNKISKYEIELKLKLLGNELEHLKERFRYLNEYNNDNLVNPGLHWVFNGEDPTEVNNYNKFKLETKGNVNNNITRISKKLETGDRLLSKINEYYKELYSPN